MAEARAGVGAAAKPALAAVQPHAQRASPAPSAGRPARGARLGRGGCCGGRQRRGAGALGAECSTAGGVGGSRHALQNGKLAWRPASRLKKKLEEKFRAHIDFRILSVYLLVIAASGSRVEVQVVPAAAGLGCRDGLPSGGIPVALQNGAIDLQGGQGGSFGRAYKRIRSPLAAGAAAPRQARRQGGSLP